MHLLVAQRDTAARVGEQVFRDAGLVGGLGDVARTDRDAQLVEPGVDRLVDRHDGTALLAVGALGVAHRAGAPLELPRSGAVELRAEAETVVALQRGGQHEGLERRPGLAEGLARVVDAQPVEPAVVGDDRPGLRVDRDQPVAQVFRLLLGLLPHDVHGFTLQRLLDRGGDLDAPGVDDVLGDAVLRELRDGTLVDVVAVVAGDSAAGLLGDVREHRERLRRALRLVDPSLLDHAVEHEVPPLLRALRVLRRVPPRRGLDDAGQHRALGHGHLRRRLVEVRLRGGLDAVGTTAEVDRVEVVLEDLVLRLLPGDLDREDDLLVLARQGEVVLAGGHLHVLLGDGGATAGAAGELVVHGAADADEVEAGVGVEGAVLGGEHRVANVLGHLVEGDRDPVAVLRAHGGDLPAVGEGERRDLGERRLLRRRHGEEEPADDERGERPDQQRAEHDVEHPTHPTPRCAGPAPLRGGTAWLGAPLDTLDDRDAAALLVGDRSDGAVLVREQGRLGAGPLPPTRRGGGRSARLMALRRATGIRRRWARPAGRATRRHRAGRARRAPPGRAALHGPGRRAAVRATGPAPRRVEPGVALITHRCSGGSGEGWRVIRRRSCVGGPTRGCRERPLCPSRRTGPGDSSCKCGRPPPHTRRSRRRCSPTARSRQVCGLIPLRA